MSKQPHERIVCDAKRPKPKPLRKQIPVAVSTNTVQNPASTVQTLVQKPASKATQTLGQMSNDADTKQDEKEEGDWEPYPADSGKTGLRFVKRGLRLGEIQRENNILTFYCPYPQCRLVSV
jgi:hypothetical protein